MSLMVKRFSAAIVLALLGMSLYRIGIAKPAAPQAIPTLQECIASVVGRIPASQPKSRPAAQPVDLEILVARYGANGDWIDVTDEVRKRVRDDALEIHAGNSIAGDPAFGALKSLRVEYRLGGQRGVEKVGEGETLWLPPQPETQPTWRSIRTPEQLVALAKTCPAEVGFYGKNLLTGRTVAYRADQPFCLASIVKLFVLAEAMHQVQQGGLSVTEHVSLNPSDPSKTQSVKKALDAMIGQSDNAATNALAARVGYNRVNALPEMLGLVGLSDQVLPEPGVLSSVLDQRVYGEKILSQKTRLPQHGTARGMVGYFERLHNRKLVNPEVSRRVLEVLERNPKAFAPRATPLECRSVGKGGSLRWIRLFHKQYNMGGWVIYIFGEDRQVAVTLCVLCEWFPDGVSGETQFQWCSTLSDCIVSILLRSR